MQLSKALILTGAATLTAAHFEIAYPEWRGDSLSGEEYSQWSYPCAGVPPDSGNVTDWPLDGGSIVLNLHHKWTYIFVNLGLGSNVTAFNMSLTEPFLNSTGNGTLCIPKLTLPSDLEVKDGDMASLQVSTLGEKGHALYNCANIRFSSNATAMTEGEGECVTNGITYSEVVAATENGDDDNEGSDEEGNGDGDSEGDSDQEGTDEGGDSGAMGLSVSTAAFTVVGMAVVFAAGL